MEQKRTTRSRTYNLGRATATKTTTGTTAKKSTTTDASQSNATAPKNTATKRKQIDAIEVGFFLFTSIIFFHLNLKKIVLNSLHLLHVSFIQNSFRNQKHSC